jgi:O-antigen ligase
MMIPTSLPMTRAFATDVFLSNSFLEPAADSVSQQYADAGEGGVRGRTLVGVSILGASFINACWPLAALLVRWPGSIGIWRALALAACVLAPMGVLMSYSRGPILGSVLIILAAFFIGLRYIRRGIIFPVAVGVLVVLFVGVGSQIFFFDRLTNRTAAMFEEPLENERETERVLAYVEPFEHVAENPRFLFFGEGIATRYSGSNRRAEQEGKATHAVFAMAYYAYGMLAAFLYMSLLFRALFHVGQKAIFEQRTLPGFLSQPLLLCLIALLPWVAFGHAAVSTPRGAMLFFLIFGLVTSLAHFQKPRRSRGRHPTMRNSQRARRRHLAFG